MEKCRYKSLEELPAIMCADNVKDVRLSRSRVQDLIIDELTTQDLKKLKDGFDTYAQENFFPLPKNRFLISIYVPRKSRSTHTLCT